MSATLVLIERKILEAILLLHSTDVRLTADVIEPIRRAIATADREAWEISSGLKKFS